MVWGAWFTTKLYQHGLLSPCPMGTIPIHTGRRRDVTNGEWWYWSIWIRQMTLWLIGHTILFNLTESLLPARVWSVLMFLYWTVATLFLTSWVVMLMTLVQGVVVFVSAVLFRSRLITWLFAGLFVYMSLDSRAYSA